jgi:signal transduction histidine kinase
VRNARQAIIATGKSGEIIVAASEQAGDWVIRVSDNGPGLPPKAREHLFTAFKGGARKGGSGLGLAIAAELVRGHGGTLKLSETSASGTVFIVTLPKGDGSF